MEKIQVLVCKPAHVGADVFRGRLLHEVADQLRLNGVHKLRICVADDDVAAASANRIIASQPPFDALLSLWVDTANCYASDLLPVIRPLVERMFAYLVTESEPLVNTDYRVPPGERTPGMNQVVVLQKPERLDYATWIDRWLNDHTPIAIATQSTFGYRQNVVCRHLGDDQPLYHAVIEENFPDAAMHNRQAFYDALGDETLYRQREKMMFDSCSRFIDFDKIDCIPMSEYNLK